jgi:cobalt-zinc-cadmium efflux system outer membrane protein
VPSIPAGVLLDDGLTEEEAVALALANQPLLQELLVDLKLAQADVIQANQLSNPEFLNLFPVGPKQWESTLTAPVEALWLRPRRVAAAQLESCRVAQRLVQDGLNAVRDTRWAYNDLCVAKGRLDLGHQAASLRKQIVDIAEARLRAGDVGELEIFPLRSDYLINLQEVQRLTAETDLARERLRALLGLSRFPVMIDVPGDLAPLPPASWEIEQLVAMAIDSRPDLAATRLAYQAAGERARLARHDYIIVRALIPDINSRGTKGFEAGPGISFTLPIFHQNQGLIARADADVERLGRQCFTLENQIAANVRQAHVRYVQAAAIFAYWHQQILPAAEAAVKQSEKALAENVILPLVVLENTRTMLAARQREMEVRGELRRALAELEWSIGRTLGIDEPVPQAPPAPPAPLPPPEPDPLR